VIRLPWLAAGLMVLLAGLTSRAQDASPVLIYVTVPADAQVAVDGVPVKQTGPERRLITPPIRHGEKGTYKFTATFTKDGKSVSVERVVTVEGGKTTRVDLTQVAPKADEPKKIDLGPAPKIEEPKKDEPKVTPKIDEPKVTPKVEEAKKEEPKVTPKVDEPKVSPKIDEPKKEVRLDVPYIPTPNKVVEEMLKLADVKAGDIVYDLGCGDGRIVITAVKDFKAKRGVGVELAPERVKLSKQNAEKAGLSDKIEIREGDVLQIKDLSDADVVALYLLPDVNEKLRPMLKRSLKPGARVVSHDFDMGPEWKPEKEISVRDEENREHTLFLWSIKERPAPFDEKPPPLKFKQAKKEEPKKRPKLDAPFVPTPQSVVEEMLKLADVKEGDIVYDLGCGDGRIVITAVKSFKAKRGVGVDLDPERIADSKKAAKDANVEDKVEFREANVLKLNDVSDATVVTLYLFPEVNEKLKPMLQRSLKPGARIVSHDFLMGDDWKPEKEINVKDAEGQEHTLFLWTIKETKKK
jgi:uncharacterized protein (TIGR03000 family)